MRISTIRILSVSCAGLGIISMFAIPTRDVGAAPPRNFRPAMPVQQMPRAPFVGGPGFGRVTTFPQIGANNFLGGPLGPAYMHQAYRLANQALPNAWLNNYNRNSFGFNVNGLGYTAAGFNGRNAYFSSFNGYASSTSYRFANFNGLTMNNFPNGMMNLTGFNGFNNLNLSGFNNLNGFNAFSPVVGGFVP